MLAVISGICAATGGNPLHAGPVAQIVAPESSDPATAAYRRELKAYTAARAAFDAAASAYWGAIVDKRRNRAAKRREHQPMALDDYVLTQPPVYTGPPKPIDPSQPPEHIPSGKPPAKYVPVITDVLQASASQYGFVPRRPASELEYKRAYAAVAAAAGLTREQIVRIYAFECGGNGNYDLQAGFEYPGPNAHAISTALGYNQLLHVNSVELMAENGDDFIKALKAREGQFVDSTALEKKIAVMRRMIAVSRTVPDAWSEHEKLADTPQGLGIHALQLDVDAGPLLQTRKLVDSVEFARRAGITQPLTAAELEMMNLTGDGSGLDMVMMPPAMRAQVPTSNFFLQASYARNPVAIRNNVVAALIAATDAKMDREVKLQGARDMAAAYPK